MPDASRSQPPQPLHKVRTRCVVREGRCRKKGWDTVGQPISALPSQPFCEASPWTYAFKEAIGEAQFSTLPSSPTVSDGFVRQLNGGVAETGGFWDCSDLQIARGFVIANCSGSHYLNARLAIEHHFWPIIIDSGRALRPTFIAPEPTVLILGSHSVQRTSRGTPSYYTASFSSDIPAL
jgi:hypothetical protein